MEPGTIVRLKADPGRVGVMTGKKRERSGGKTYWQVQFPDGADFYREIHLEIISEGTDDPIELLQQGKLGRARDLRGNLTHIRLTGRLANLIYSMDTTNTDFYAYQFKPVLNFLDTPANGLLIADEVGLGKTIEAGLIWTELRSRYDIRKVMVLCPAMLQQKWRDEMRLRFGIDAEILGAFDANRTFQELNAGDRFEFAVICSMQGLRPRRGWDRDDENQDNSSRLARFLRDNQFDEPLLDLLIIDEAHYLRNPESMTSNLGRLLRDVSEHVLLLSATPIHLKNRDLYQLLNLVDENTFNQPQVFDEILEANAPILRARDAVLHEEIGQEQFISLIEEARSHPFLSESRQIAALLDNPPTDERLKDIAFRTILANRLENINLLGRIVNRTRKREVTEWRVVRESVPEMVPLSDVERTFYNEVTDLVRDYAINNGGYEAFLLVMPQRQMSSSMPAAIEEWQRRGRFRAEQAFEDLGIEQADEELGPLTQELVNRARDMGDLELLRANDSKYQRLVKMLTMHLNNYPDEKVVLFAYFRATLHYLKKRLTEDGITCITLMGGGSVDKYEIIREFQAKGGPQVLLSSEVASEGVDLQFSRVLINYDLPWNPMKVEQRIGRIDRLGQKSPKITIWNLFYEDTIDARIYTRLYERLGIFERALGGLEAVLGDEIRRLTADLMRGKLTAEQEIARIEQAAQALSNLKAQEEKLEEEATNLVAHGDYILHQVKAARELQRTIRSYDIWTYIYDFFIKEYVGTEFNQLKADELIFDIKLSDEAKLDLEHYLKEHHLSGQTRLSSAYPPKIRCRIKNQVGRQQRGRDETISQFHPLVRFVSDKIKSSSFDYYSPISVEVSKQEIPDVEPGVYAFSVERWSLHGIREIERLHAEAGKMDDENSFLPEDKAEKLVTVAARNGRDWLSAVSEVNLDAAVRVVEECLEMSETKYEEYVDQVESENNDRADIQEKSLMAHQERQKEKLEALRDRQVREGKDNIARMTQGRIDALKNRLDQKIVEINSRRNPQHNKKEICIGVINVTGTDA